MRGEQPRDNLRADGSRKGNGYFGKLERPDGRVSTEISVSVDIDGKRTEIPLLVPTLRSDEIDKLLSLDPSDEIPRDILLKAQKFAVSRIASGRSPFWQEGEEAYKRPPSVSRD